MDIQEVLRTRLVENQTVAALTANYLTSKAVFWFVRPQGSDLSALVLNTVSAPLDDHMQGLQSLQFMRLQIDSYGADPTAAQQLADAAVGALLPREMGEHFYFRRASLIGRRDLTDTTRIDPIYRTSLDLRVRFSPA